MHFDSDIINQEMNLSVSQLFQVQQEGKSHIPFYKHLMLPSPPC